MIVDTKKAILVGAVTGVVSGALTLLVGALSMGCCLLGYLNWFGPLLAGVVGGVAASAAQPWDTCASGDGVKPGASSGAVGAGVSAGLTALAYLLVVVLRPIFLMMFRFFVDSMDVDTLLILFFGEAFRIGMGVVVAIFSCVAGVLFGVAGGAMMGAVRAPAA